MPLNTQFVFAFFLLWAEIFKLDFKPMKLDIFVNRIIRDETHLIVVCNPM